MQIRSIFFSDCHLGMSESHAKDLTKFLLNNSSENIFILGDLIDLWAIELHPTWPPENTELLSTLITLAKNTNIVFIPGNHDEALISYAGMTFANIRIKTEVEYISVKGKRFLLCHGNKFDNIVSTYTWLAIFGSRFNNVLLYLDPIVDFLRQKLGLGKHWSLAGHVKGLIRNTKYVNSFKLLLTNYVKSRGFDGVIAGHIHRPAIENFNNTLYYNDGDVITGLTVLVETIDGEFNLINLGEL